MTHVRKIALAVVLVWGCLALPSAAQACPGCAEAQAGQGPSRTNIVRGYQLSIIFMMAMPFLIVGSFGGYVYYTVYRGRNDSEAAPPSADASAGDGDQSRSEPSPPNDV